MVRVRVVDAHFKMSPASVSSREHRCGRHCAQPLASAVSVIGHQLCWLAALQCWCANPLGWQLSLGSTTPATWPHGARKAGLECWPLQLRESSMCEAMGGASATSNCSCSYVCAYA
jgi:hypothetical protein